MGMTDERERATQPDESIDRASRIIAQALMEAEVILALEREKTRDQLSPQVVETLERFGNVLGKLVEHTEHLAERMVELTEAVAALADVRSRPGAVAAGASSATPQLPEMERAFAPGGEGIDVTIQHVPGFQGLMELQRALVRLPQVQSAAVRKYQDDEAAIQLVLAQPMTASAIAEGITQATGHAMIVDEARHDQLRLNLRFLQS